MLHIGCLFANRDRKMEQQVPLCVDLDGTVVYGDMSLRSFISYIKFNPLRIFRVLWWHRLGRAYTKYKLCKHYSFDCSKLRYIPQTLEFIRQERLKGRRIYLCTGSNVLIAHRISRHLGLFDDVFATYVKKNFIGRNKAAVLVKAFGEKGFDYVGNAMVDLKVWEHARMAVVVNASPAVEKKALEMFGSERVKVLK